MVSPNIENGELFQQSLYYDGDLLEVNHFSFLEQMVAQSGQSEKDPEGLAGGNPTICVLQLKKIVLKRCLSYEVWSFF